MEDYKEAKMFMRNKFTSAIVEVMTKNYFAPSRGDIRKEIEVAMDKASTIHKNCPMNKRARLKYAEKEITKLEVKRGKAE